MAQMAQGLQLSQRLTQSLVLSPQLQHSLALLQAPTLELKALVEQELEQNPVLEEIAPPDAEAPEKPISEEEDAPGESVPDTAAERAAEAGAEPDTEQGTEPPVDDFQAEFDKLVQIDQEWRDHFSQTNTVIRRTEEDDEKRQFMFDSLAVGKSLGEVLMEQVRDTDLTAEQRGIADLIVGNIDDYGYLKSPVEELAATTTLPADKITGVLKTIQSFDPPGVGARDLRECLMLQLERADRQETLEYRIIRDFMEELGCPCRQ